MYLPPDLLQLGTRLRHVHLLGQTGVGKSTLMEEMIAADIESGAGVAVIDPHGSLCERVLSFIPTSRAHDLIYLNAADKGRPVSFNPLSDIAQGHDLIADNMVSMFAAIFGEDAIGPRSQQVLRNSVRAILHTDDPSLLCVLKILRDKDYRTGVLDVRDARGKPVQDPVVLAYWRDEFDQYDKTLRSQVIGPILNKLDAFLPSPTVRNIICARPKFSVERMFEENDIFVVNLDKGKVGEKNAHRLGAMVFSRLMHSAFARSNTSPFYVYIDEFQNFISGDIPTTLSESRKKKLGLVLANQYLGQLPDQVRQAVMGNTGTILCFRVGPEDASAIAPIFELHQPILVNDKISETACEMGIHTPQHLSNLPNHTYRMRVFPDHAQEHSTRVVPEGRDTDALKRNSRIRFGREMVKVEQLTQAFLGSK